MESAVSAIQAWDKAGRPMKSWAEGGELARDAASAIAALEGTFRSLPDGQYWRGTNRPAEVAELLSGKQLVSSNHVTGGKEAGLSVSETPATIFAYGYKHGYPVTGDIVGHGSDGEPLLGNVKPVTAKAMAAKMIFAKDKARLEQLKGAMATLEKHTGIQSSLLDWLRHN